MKMNRGLLFGLPIVAGILMIFSCASPGITDLDNSQISQKVCSDYDPGTAPADCVTSQEAIQGEDPAITHPWLFGLAVVIALAWAAMLAKAWSDRETARDVAARSGSSSYLLAPLALQDSSLVGSGGAGWEGGVATLLVILGGIGVIVFIVRIAMRGDGDDGANADPYQ